MTKTKRKQFSLSLLMRIFLGIIVLVSIAVFANSIMRYNALMDEKRELDAKLQRCKEAKEELLEQVGSAKKLEVILNDYAEYTELRNSGSAAADALMVYEEEIRELLSDEDTREYLIRLAREQGLAFPDEILYYSDRKN